MRAVMALCAAAHSVERPGAFLAGDLLERGSNDANRQTFARFISHRFAS